MSFGLNSRMGQNGEQWWSGGGVDYGGFVTGSASLSASLGILALLRGDTMYYYYPGAGGTLTATTTRP
jgi:hypothetical protein